jgi:hypothetical protein
MSIELNNNPGDKPVIEITLKELQEGAMRKMSRYLTPYEIEVLYDLSPIFINDMISLAVEAAAVEPDWSSTNNT